MGAERGDASSDSGTPKRRCNARIAGVAASRSPVPPPVQTARIRAGLVLVAGAFTAARLASSDRAPLFQFRRRSQEPRLPAPAVSQGTDAQRPRAAIAATTGRSERYR